MPCDPQPETPEDDMGDDEQEPEDNILEALLELTQDSLAIDYMGYYVQFLNTDLFLFSLKNSNQYFIKTALKMGAFDKQIFKDPEIADKMIEQLDVSMNTNILLNILVLIDISVWGKDKIEKLLEKFETFVGENYDTNPLMLSNNPLMSLALTAELLLQIAVAK